MSRISAESIEEVRTLTDVVDVVGDYVRLKKRGSNFVGLCPFHSEKTPSFNVNPARAIYKCFGCGEGGDVFNFVSEVEGLSFPEAVRLLADRAGVALPDEDEPDDEANEAEAVSYALRFAARWFFNELTHSESGKIARDYLSNRGISAETVKAFGVGFAPAGWDNLVREITSGSLNPDIVESSGLIIRRKEKDGFYDRYRNRVIFPIVSHVGKVIGFGGRVIDPEDEPKYINSPESPVYNKSRVLYGLYQARNDIRAKEEALLVEGYTDVLALQQAGVTNAVATCGTALTSDQIQLISRYANRVVLLYDADGAGVRAAFRAIDLVLEKGLAAYAVALPEGEDPDSFVQSEGGVGFEKYLKEHRQDFVRFILENSRKSGATDTPEGLANVQRTVLSSISKIPDPLVKESYLKHASAVLDIPDNDLRAVIKGMRPRKYQQSRQRDGGGQRDHGQTSGPPPAIQVGDPSTEKQETAPHPSEKSLLRLMLENGLPLVELILGNTAVTEYTEGPAREMVQVLVKMYQDQAIDPASFVEGTHGKRLMHLSAELMMHDVEPSENWQRRKNIPVPKLNENARSAAIGAMTKLKTARVEEQIVALNEQIRRAGSDETQIRELQEQMMALHEKRKHVMERKFVRDV